MAIIAKHLMRPQLGTVGVILATSLWLAGIGNVALWQALLKLPEVGHLQGALFLGAFFVLIAALQTAFLTLFAWRWTLKPAIAFCLVAAALGANFMLSYGIVIDKSMMVNVVQTDIRESKELLSVQLFVVLGLVAALPLWWLWRLEVRSVSLLSQLRANLLTAIGAVLVAVAVVMLSFQSMATMMRNHKEVRFMINPLNSIYALAGIALDPFTHPKKAMVKIGQDAHIVAQSGAKPKLLILVIGETARAANFSLNGYARDTNPELANEDVVSYTKVYACGTSTAASVPCMFSHLGRAGYIRRDADYSSLLDVLKSADAAVLWRDNNSGCKGTCSGVPYENMNADVSPEQCKTGECMDEILLTNLDASLKKLYGGKAPKDTVVVLHQAGSHGPTYYRRSPAEFKKFMPECTTNILQQCTQAQVINAYDNTILYTDHMLAETVKWLKARSDRYDTAMLYVSDHGESLGENNTYLHGLPHLIAPDVQKRVPMIAWLSPQLEQRTGITQACLQSRRDIEYSHDNLFHSVLGLMGVQTAVYRPELNIFKGCS